MFIFIGGHERLFAEVDCAELILLGWHHQQKPDQLESAQRIEPETTQGAHRYLPLHRRVDLTKQEHVRKEGGKINERTDDEEGRSTIGRVLERRQPFL